MGQKFLLYRPITSLSARKLAKSLNIEAGHYYNGELDFLLRWGSSEKVKHKPKLVLNKRQAILNCVNKRKTKKILNAADIDTPKTYNNSNVKYPCIVRPLNHNRGRDFCLVESIDNMPMINEQTHYISEYFDKVDDYRLLLFKDLLLVGYKWVKDKNKIANTIIRNDDNGWSMINIPLKDFPHGLLIKGFKALDAMKLDFGAIDMGVNKKGRVVVYEVNTGPFLDDTRLALMSDAIKDFAKKKGINLD